MTLELDPDLARRAADGWNDWGDQLYRAQLDLARDLETLALATRGTTVCWYVATASTELWKACTFARMVADAVVSADAIDVDELAERAGRGAPLLWHDPARPGNRWYSSRDGDFRGTLDRELRSPFHPSGASDLERGRYAVATLLAHTHDRPQIRPDEFEIIEIDPDTFVVVLPGVTDLSEPSVGFSDVHGSIRDLDQVAYRSSTTTAVADNAFAQMVIDGLSTHGVPEGASVMLVGHSFGADTALDLAADRAFTGPDGYQVTHVVAAGYHSEPQLRDVPDDVEVLVLQNYRDAAVIGEALFDHHAQHAIDAIDDIDPWNPVSAVVGTLRSQMEINLAVGAAVGSVVSKVPSAAWEQGKGVAQADAGKIVSSPTKLITLPTGVSRVGRSQVVDVFHGGGTGRGHDPDNYVEHVLDTDAPDVERFLASVATAGYTAPGTAYAVDVSARFPRSAFRLKKPES